MKNINSKLSIKKYIDLMQTSTDFRFNVFDMISALVYARLVQPCSKFKTSAEVIPILFESYDFSLNQLYDGLEYIGCKYKKIIKIYNHQIVGHFLICYLAVLLTGLLQFKILKTATVLNIYLIPYATSKLSKYQTENI